MTILDSPILGSRGVDSAPLREASAEIRKKYMELDLEVM